MNNQTIDGRVGESIVINYERREAVEVFRASGVVWVRYRCPNGENRYATEDEWDLWIEQNHE